MKIIDIFNKIVNNEEVPKKVKFNYKIYTYNPEWKDYVDEKGTSGLFVDVISNSYQITKMLNEEIEIIEEDKKIEKINILVDDTNMEYVADYDDRKLSYSKVDLLFAYKINELIEVNKLKGKEN